MAPLPVPHDLSSSTCSCRAYVHGAHVVDWTPTGSEPVLWLSPRARLESSAAIRGGVPIIFPWFGSGLTGGMTPSHGFGRLSDWRLASLECASDRATAEFALDSNHVTSAEFPHPYEVRYSVSAGEHLTLALTVRNTGEEPFTYEDALHTYLAVGDVTEVTVLGLDGAEYVDQAAGPSNQLPVQAGPIRFESEVDRVYRSTGEIRVVDPVLGRMLVVRKLGSRSTIVWNPGGARAAEPKAADIGPEHWREFVCIEAGNVADGAVLLAPGDTSTLNYELRVEALPT